MTTVKNKFNVRNVAKIVIPFAIAQALIMSYWHFNAEAKMKKAEELAQLRTPIKK
ncbi:hypothetical protein [Achromobacter xylosoxidans]|uniref:hypothetical protein n=1 Tax=Alcaligenes xylosoxydans xylosoxydans TaxID=85698 RepID=UPI0006C2DFC0|nr:hypothetical protein [Achromobacter xylosoxidans]CUJ71879.1 Uncharacterised protein [Achromobacter xylosoxidans]